MVSRLRTRLTAAILLTALNGFTQDAKSGAATYGSDTYESGGAALTALERRGRDTWYFWTGGDQRLWRKLAIVTNGVTDLLLYVDSRRNGHRFRDLGVITQPGCRAADQPDEFGLWFDNCASENLADIPGQPTGILGLRKFPNPEFDKTKWSIEKYRQNPKKSNRRTLSAWPAASVTTL